MVKGLAIRQFFVVLDFILAVLVAVIAYFTISAVIEGDKAGALRSVESAIAEPSSVDFPVVGPRDKYAGIRSDLYGEAGALMASADSKPVDEAPVAQPSLPLTLFGTVATENPHDPLATAVIENGQSHVVDTYYQGQEIAPQIVLAEVYPNRVVLVNKMKNNQREVLTKTEQFEQQPASVGQAMPASFAGGAAGDANAIVLNKNELQRDLESLSENTVQALSDLNPRPVTDEQNKVIGYTADNLNDFPLAQKLGLRDGDVLQAINGLEIDTEDKVVEAMGRFRNMPVWRISILRNNRPTTIQYRLE